MFGSSWPINDPEREMSCAQVSQRPIPKLRAQRIDRLYGLLEIVIVHYCMSNIELMSETMINTYLEVFRATGPFRISGGWLVRLIDGMEQYYRT